METYDLPSPDNWWEPLDPSLERVSHVNRERIKELLLGKTVTKVNDNHLVLSDGTVLRLDGNCGGCSCGAGDYELTELNECPVNVIMNVEFETDTSACDNEWGGGTQVYRIFVLAEDRRIKLAEFEGDDGNGYYGTGYWITVKDPEQVAE